MNPMPAIARSDDSADLLRRIADGDEIAFQHLYERLKATCYGLALRVTRDEHIAQDVLQEAFSDVWSQAHRYDPRLASAGAWVTVLTHRRAVDRVRQEESDRRRGTRWATATHDPDHDHVAEVVDMRAEHRLASSAKPLSWPTSGG